MRVLFIDDEPIRAQKLSVWGHDVFLAQTVEQVIFYKQRGGFDLICLDHDLGPINGYDIVQNYIIRMPSPVVVHSANEQGAKNICRILEEHEHNHIRIPITEEDWEEQVLDWWTENFGEY